MVLGLWGGIAFAGVLVYFAAKMPPTSDWTVPKRPPNVRIVDVNGKLLANRGTTGGQALTLKEMSPYIPKAVVAIEDRRFYSHFGIDPIGLARAFVTNILTGHTVQGGSTLTQQLAKNLFLSPDRTLERKVQEVMLALWLEHKYTKDQILEMYLNRVYLGSGAFGVDAAARRYFNKSAKDVTLMEAATIAGLLKAPSRLSPARDPEAAYARAKLVLAAMRDEGMIDDRQVAIAESEPMERAPAYWQGSENFVADKVVAALPGLIGDAKTDITVQTTVDLNLQKVGEAAIKDQIAKNGKKLHVSQGALVSIDDTGAVRAMVGGVDYATSQFDHVTDAHRQPASTFKPFVYLSALEQGRTPDSVRNDAPVRIGNWTPGNDDGKYMGEVTLATEIVPQAGYPWRLHVETTYRLSADGLTQTVAATNRSADAAPFGTGPHPYLVAGPARLDEWTLDLPADQVLEVTDAQLAPIGLADVTGSPRFDWRAERTLGDVEIDHAFTGLQRTDGAAVVRLTDPSGTGVEMVWDAACPWVQIHTADLPPLADGSAPAGHRAGLAVEPMTCAPDAFNAERYDYDAGLVVIEPGATAAASWRIAGFAR